MGFTRLSVGLVALHGYQCDGGFTGLSVGWWLYMYMAIIVMVALHVYQLGWWLYRAISGTVALKGYQLGWFLLYVPSVMPDFLVMIYKTSSLHQHFMYFCSIVKFIFFNLIIVIPCYGKLDFCCISFIYVYLVLFMNQKHYLILYFNSF